MLFRSIFLVFSLVAATPLGAQPRLVAIYTFDTASSIDEWERSGPGFVPSDQWGEINWDGRDGHPAPGSMELVDGPGNIGSLVALGPCLPPLPFGDRSIVEVNAVRKNVTNLCDFGFFGYESTDCSGPLFGSTQSPRVNPDGFGEWLFYRNQLILSQPEVGSLRAIASIFAGPGQSCKVDTIQVVLTPPTPADVPIHPAALSILVVTLAGIGLWILRLRM